MVKLAFLMFEKDRRILKVEREKVQNEKI